MNDLLQDGTAAVKAGDKDTGKKLLARVLQSDSHNEDAWLWLSYAVDEVAQKRECLEQVLAINPDNEQARLLLEKANRRDKQVWAEQAQRATLTQRKAKKEPVGKAAKSARPPASSKAHEKETRFNLTVVLGLLAVLAISLYCCISTSPLIRTPASTRTPSVERGWLCDWDGRGEVALWAKPTLAYQDGNSIVAVVGMSVKGCIDVILLDETTTDGILFYKVRVAGDQGWVDVDYFYPTFVGKPDWSR